MFSRALLALLLCLLPVSLTWAAACDAIWPARNTPNATVIPSLPSFTGSGALTLPRVLGAGEFHYGVTTVTSGDLTVSGGASTRLYFNGNLVIGGSSDFNQSGPPEDLIIIVNGNLTFTSAAARDRVNVNAIIYATGNVTLTGDTRITGSVTAGGSISVPGQITYDPGAVANADFGSLCGTPPVVSAPVLDYVSSVCGDARSLLVSFNAATGQERLSSSAEVLTNYRLVSASGATVSITRAELADNGFDVVLSLATPLVEGTRYTLTVNNISDELGGTLVSAVDSLYFTATQSGMIGSYFNNTTLTNPVTRTQIDTTINDSWGWFDTPFGLSGDGFSIRWEGFFEPAVSGSYQFRTVSDDGVRLWVRDLASPRINNWTNHAATTDTSGAFALNVGERYPFVLEYYNRSANFEVGEIRLDWRLNSGTYRTVSSTSPNGLSVYTCRTAPVINNGLVVEYRLDGPVWNGSPNEVVDSSGLNANGNTVNGTRNGPARVCNGAIMNGSNFIRIPDNVDLDLTDELTVTAWINLTSLGTELKSILSKDENYEFHINNTGAIYWWWNSNAGTRSFTSGTTRIRLGQWEHVAIVYRDGRQSIYLNGVEVAFRTYSGERLVTNADPLEIGADQGLTNRNWIGSIDEIKIFKKALTATDIQAIMNETRTCPSALDRFAITAAATASVCAPTTVTVTALQADGSTYTGYTGSINLETSSARGNWARGSGNGVLSPNPDNDDNGLAQYTFVAADNGRVNLQLSNTHADQLTITATDSGGVATGTSSAIQFSENALQISVTDDLGSDFVAGRNHAISIEMLRRDPVTGSCGRFLEYNGDFSLKAWLTHSGAVPASLAPSISTTTSPVSLPAAQPATNNVTLNFAQGLASATWITTDVGQYSFNLLDDSSGLVVDVNDEPLDVVGSSAQWTARPFAFDVQATGNPAAASAGDAAFVKAGADFPVTVRAVLHQGADDNDDNGYPDTGAILSDNGVTPAFGTEGESVVLNSSLLLPADPAAHDPGLTGGTAVSSFTGGSAITTLRYEEVGIIQLNAALADNSYLGSNPVTGRIDRVGRFYPDYFTVVDNAPQLRDGTGSWSCGFTYQGQPFGFSSEPQLTVQAHSVTGQITRNYSTDFWKLTEPQHTLLLDVSSLPTGSVCESGGSVVAGCFDSNSASVSRNLVGHDDFDGDGVLVFGTHSMTINKRNTTPDAGDVPYDPAVDLVIAAAQFTDADGACYKVGVGCADYRIDDIGHATATGSHLRWGRGWVDSAVGSVLTPLPVTLRLQYWNSLGGFQLNEDDDVLLCGGTAVSAPDIALSDFTDQLAAGETSVNAVSPFPGYHVLTLTAPGYQGTTPNTGRVQLTWNLASWLQSDLDGDGSVEPPYGYATFSAQPGKQPILFMREVYR